MKTITLLTALLMGTAVFAAPVNAQTSTPRSNRPAQQPAEGPFGTQWAKPAGKTGGYIYNDPRLRDPNRSNATQSGRRCPAPTLYDPASGACR